MMMKNKILEGRTTGTGSTINGECCMLSKYGDVYPCIDNKYHPNPGTYETGYEEIELPVDWLIRNDLGDQSDIRNWIAVRVNEFIDEVDNPSVDTLAEDVVFYTDKSNLSDKTIKLVEEVYNKLISDKEYKEYVESLDELELADSIAKDINEKFTRVRAGGKLDSRGSDEIYFRISSHGYDWNRVITDFLWDTFGEPKSMPRRIWIGHDAETNPPEIVLFDGTPEELFEKYDGKKFENYKRRMNVNQDREAYRLNTEFYKIYKNKKFM